LLLAIEELPIAFVLGVVKSIIFQGSNRSWILPDASHGTSSYTSYVGGICGITVFSLYWFCDRTIQIDY
jgi:hypothetical protein